ncbi:MAG: dynamin family protein [Myxococcales bacterium]|nr:dynamin family protein [Myxococcales bacterium]
MIDYGDLKTQVLSSLRDVARLAEESGARTLARALREDRIARLEDERFHLVVLGEFNHGKTTFVNALLGAAVLPMGVTPTTAVIHRIQHGEQGTAKAFGEDGLVKSVPMDALVDYEVDGKALQDAVQHLDVFYPSDFLADGVVLVDTPGVNDLNEARAEITYGYIPRSDAILFLLDAGQILKESERQFVANKLLAQSRDKVIFVVNKMDLLDDEEREEALAYARTNLGKLIEDPKVFGISAERALEGQRDGSGLDTLLGELDRFLKDERGRVLLDNALDSGLRTVGTLRTGIEIQKRALAMEQGDLERRLGALEADLETSAERMAERKARIRESISAVKALVRADVEGFARRFAQQLPEEIDSADAKDLRKYLGGFIEERFKTFSEQEAEEIARRLEKVAEEAIAFVTEDAAARAEHLRELMGDDAPALDLQVNTFAYDVGVFAIGAFGVTLMVLSNVLVGGALALAAPVLAYVFRGRADKQVKEKAKEEAPKAVIAAAAKMADAFDARIDEVGDKLLHFVSAANAEVTRSIAELVRTAREAGQRGDVAREELSSATGMNLARLGEVESKMSQVRKTLWANGSAAE